MAGVIQRGVQLNPTSMPFNPAATTATTATPTAREGSDNASDFNTHASSASSALSISPSDYKSVRSSPSPPAGKDTPGPTTASTETSTSGTGSPFFPDLTQRRIATPPTSALTFNVNGMNTTSKIAGLPFSNPNPFAKSASPVSSLDSAGGSLGGPAHPDFDAQLRASPLLHDMLERLRLCELVTRDIQREMRDVHTKVNVLLDRSLNAAVERTPALSAASSGVEFKDPFAPQPPLQQQQQPRFSSPGLGPRASMGGGIAPHQQAPPGSADDIGTISARLNTLTSSVGQLLALQTQQHIQAATGEGPPPSSMQPPHPGSQGNLGHGLPNRPAPRVPNPPLRTWSAGTLDLPMRPPDATGSLGRGMDKRRSVTGLMRRDSAGMLDSPDWQQGGNSPRDNGAMVSKWEQLSLAPDLLRSLNKFGVGPPNKIQQRALPFLLRGSDIIAQAPPTQERIAAYVIPAIQTAVTSAQGKPAPAPAMRGPVVIMVSTTVDQATQAQRMIRDLGGPIGIRSALGVGAAGAGTDIAGELRLLQQSMPHIICGTPQKLHALFTSPGGLSGAEVRFLVLDEVDQLIARNLHEFVFSIVKLLPPPRSRPLPGSATPGAPNGTPAQSQSPFAPPLESNGSGSAPGSGSGFAQLGPARRFSTITAFSEHAGAVERQTALFSNTVPQDVLNLASAIQLKEPVRVLVRRDGGSGHGADTGSGGARGLRQFYLYLAFTAGGRADPLAGGAAGGGGLGIIGSGRGSSSAESAQAREWKLDALADLFEDVEVTQAIVHVGGMTALDSVVYKLASRGLEAVPLHGDMNAGTKLAALNKFRSTTSVIMRQPVAKVLVVYDVQVKTPEVSHVPLIINYDLPKAVEEYAHRVAPAIASNYSRAGVVVNFVTATGGDVEMLRSIECFYKIKCPEVPMSLRDVV